LCNITGLTEVV